MTLPELVDQRLSEVASFITALEELTSSAERSEEYRRISKLVRFAQRFYEVFFEQEFGVKVRSFAFQDKRVVADEVTDAEEERAEQDENGDDERENLKLDLAYRYLEVCDQLHGDLEFGYSLDDADFVVFHEETFPDWLEEVADWMRIEGNGDLADRAKELSRSYRNAV